MSATWPSKAQSAVLSAASVKLDFPSDEAYTAAALKLGCAVAAIKAVAEVEAVAEGAFLDSGEPLALFERHHFHRLTGGRFTGVRVPSDPSATPPTLPASVSLLSSPKPGGYGSIRIQHRKLAAAAALDREAAFKSASLGAYQIMGFNHAAAGHLTLQDFINAAYRSADDHLAMFVAFILADPWLVKALRVRDWKTFKRIYNGPGPNDYATRMATAYVRLAQETQA